MHEQYNEMDYYYYLLEGNRTQRLTGIVPLYCLNGIGTDITTLTALCRAIQSHPQNIHSIKM